MVCPGALARTSSENQTIFFEPWVEPQISGWPAKALNKQTVIEGWLDQLNETRASTERVVYVTYVLPKRVAHPCLGDVLFPV